MRAEIGMNGLVKEVASNSTEVIVKPQRRRFSEAYIDAILKELDTAAHGEKGKILRREGLFSKQVTSWRKQRESGSKVKRGPRSKSSVDMRKELAAREREIARLRRKLEQAEIIIDVQKKVALLLRSTDQTEEPS
ncbi:MAG: hypothetical protein D8M52_09205 [Chlorobi bacterium]|nr:hypothetical protein [Chlorobiota bacterium]NOG68347.1 transposase [Chlorobiota bacterium]QOJ26965.1 MAG: transposase [Ignavibacteria bacterium]WKZ78485.1 MAG: hypothetical protein QY319_03490 [Candidatus Kapabacteria bacterium]